MQVGKLTSWFLLATLALVASARGSDWTAFFDLPGGDNGCAVATTVDADGYTYVLATCTNENDTENIVVLRYSPDGSHDPDNDEWIYDSGVDAEAMAFVLKRGTGVGQDTIFVLGDTVHVGQPPLPNTRGGLVMKFIPGTSDTAWVRAVGDPLADNAPAGIAIRPQTGAWLAVAVNTRYPRPGYDDSTHVLTCRFNSDGTVPSGWPAAFRNGQRSYPTDSACAVMIDANGYVYVAGTTNSDANTVNYDFCTLKYDSVGGEHASSDPFPWTVPDGNANSVATRIGRYQDYIIVAGTVATGPTHGNLDSVRVVKYYEDPNNGQVQRDAVAYVDHDDDDPVSVKLVDMVVESEVNDGEIHWVGLSDGESPFVTYEYNSTDMGTRWKKGARHYEELGMPAAVAADFWQNSYVVGNVTDEISDAPDICIVKYDAAGTPRYYEGCGSSTTSDSAVAVAAFQTQHGDTWCVVVGCSTDVEEGTGGVLVMRRDMELHVGWSQMSSVPLGPKLKRVKDGGSLAADGSSGDTIPNCRSPSASSIMKCNALDSDRKELSCDL